MNKKWINSTLNCEAYSSFEGVSSDHWIIRAKIHLSLRKVAVQIISIAQYHWSLLNSRDISNKYTITQRNNFDTLQEISETLTPNDEYENSINAYIEATTECIPTKEKKLRVPLETLTVKKKRDKVKTAPLCNRRNPCANALKLEKSRSELNNAYLKEQTEYIQNQINKIDDGQSRIAWQRVNKVSRRKSTAKAKERIHLWKQHFENLLGKPPKVTHEPIPKLFVIN